MLLTPSEDLSACIMDYVMLQLLLAAIAVLHLAALAHHCLMLLQQHRA